MVMSHTPLRVERSCTEITRRSFYARMLPASQIGVQKQLMTMLQASVGVAASAMQLDHGWRWRVIPAASIAAAATASSTTATTAAAATPMASIQ